MQKTEMKKAMFETFNKVLKTCRNKDVKVELRELSNLKSICESLGKSIKRREATITKDKLACKHCGFYFKPDPKKQYTSSHIETRTSYSDAGYGDYDRHADYEVVEYFQLCPKCQKPVRLAKDPFISKIPGTDKDRWGEVWG